MRNLRFFADAQNDIVGVGGFRRPDICRLLSVICRLICHSEEQSDEESQFGRSKIARPYNKIKQNFKKMLITAEKSDKIISVIFYLGVKKNDKNWNCGLR